MTRTLMTLLILLTGLSASAQKAPRKPVRPATPPTPVVLPPAAGEQLAAAALTYFGAYACEFNQSLQVSLNARFDGYVDVRFGKQSYTMKPVLSHTGALRLEDVRGRMLLLQIGVKSMLFDVQTGHRLVDECVHETQVENRRVIAAAPPQPGLGIATPLAAETAASAAATPVAAPASAASAAATAVAAPASAASAVATTVASPASAASAAATTVASPASAASAAGPEAAALPAPTAPPAAVPTPELAASSAAPASAPVAATAAASAPAAPAADDR